jgi:hypothetical protein
MYPIERATALVFPITAEPLLSSGLLFPPPLEIFLERNAKAAKEGKYRIENHFLHSHLSDSELSLLAMV